MHWKIFVITLVYCLVNAQAKNCELDDVSKIREFGSLLEYQRNVVSFNCQDDTYRGSSVNFSFRTIERLQKNSFITYSSDYVRTIDLSNKEIKRIDDGAFISLTSLYALDLSNNLISNLTDQTFTDLSNLGDLNLSKNRLTYVYNNVFSNTRSLVRLDLSYNNISETDRTPFANNLMLEKLRLSHNRMKHIGYIFSNLVNLRELCLDHNSLAIISVDLFSRNVLLEKLDVSGNEMALLRLIDGCLHPEAMQLFNLSNNYLIQLNVSWFVNQFSNSKTLIDLNDNQFYCSEWRNYSEEFRSNNVTIVPGRSFNAKRHMNGMSCDNLDFTLPLDYLHKDLNENANNQYDNSSSSEEPNEHSEHCLLRMPDENSLSLKYVIIVLAVIGSAFCIFLTLDYVLDVGFRERLTRSVRLCLLKTAPNIASNDSSYIQLNPDL